MRYVLGIFQDAPQLKQFVFSVGEQNPVPPVIVYLPAAHTPTGYLFQQIQEPTGYSRAGPQLETNTTATHTTAARTVSSQQSRSQSLASHACDCMGLPSPAYSGQSSDMTGQT